jgi:dipeptidyl aminopeptidase/acylaminoacyl peptidase
MRSAAVLLMLAGNALAAPGNRITPEAIVSMRTVQSAMVRPNGNEVVYVVTEPPTHSKDPANTELWITDGTNEKRLTNNPGTDAGPQWSPNGEAIAFLSNRAGDNGNQLYLHDRRSGEALKLTKLDDPVVSFMWAPDGKRIAYLAAGPMTPEESKQKAGGDDEIVFGISDHDRHARPNKLWLFDVATRSSRAIRTGGPQDHVRAVAWSPNGSSLLLTVSRDNNMDAEWIGSRLATVDFDGGDLKTYCAPPGRFGNPQWKPDGSAVSFLGASEARDPSAGILYTCVGSGSKPEPLTPPDFPATLSGHAWLPDGKSVLLTVMEKNSRYLARFDLATRAITRLTKPGEVVSADVSLAKDGQRLACIIESYNKPPDVWTGALSDLQRVTRLNPELEKLEYGNAEDVEWKAKDGLLITGILIKPVGFERGRRYPLIVQVHGGPESVDLNGFQVQWGQFLASHGYAVLFPNYRGSVGRGAKYTLMGNKGFGGDDFGDIQAGVDEMIARGITDSDHLGIGGWSYGGFMSAWAVTQTNRFKASVMGVGVSNWYSLMGQTPLPLWTVQVHFETWPYDDPAAFRKNSPIEFVKQVRTPTLILHGEVDPMIPLSQAKEFFRALQHYNVPSELVVYPREGHGLREPVHRLRAYARILHWYDRYVKGTSGNAH